VETPAPILQAPEYRFTASDALEVSTDGGKSWAATVSPTATTAEASPSSSHLLAYGWDSAAPNRVAVVAADRLYLSEDSGSSWKDVPIKDHINRNVKLTAVDLSPFDRNTMLVGTSFDGFYETTDMGKTWKQVCDTPSLKFFYRGAGFWEEVTSVDYVPSDPESVRFTLGYGYGTYEWNRRSGKITRLDTGNGIEPASLETSVPSPPLTAVSPAAKERMAKASNRVGIYVSPVNAKPDRLPAYLALAKKEGLNSIVVDFKDDFGLLRYKSEVKVALEAGAVHPLFNARYLIEQAHANGIYVIARMVVFKDRELYYYEHGKYALWDSTTNKPWGVYRKETVPVEQPKKDTTGQSGDGATTTDQKKTEEKTVQVEWWVDPYSSFVWDYNIAIAKELQKLGVDEVQFDYIRFPSDGYVSHIVSHYKDPGMDRVGALSGFLKKARESLDVPISIDVYGFNSWYRTVYLGQDIEELSRYVDVVCPMFYPSHFSTNFYPKMSYLDRAEFIYQEGSRRAEDIVHGTAIIRPWVQAFLIGGELKFDKPTYWKYLTNQLTGAAKGKVGGYVLWNASGHYYMVAHSIRKYTVPYSDAAIPPVVSNTP
jgi:hypothetical protein